MPPRSEGLLTASTQTVPMDGAAHSSSHVGEVALRDRTCICNGVGRVHAVKTYAPRRHDLVPGGRRGRTGIISTIRSHRRHDIPSVTARTSLSWASVGQANDEQGRTRMKHVRIATYEIKKGSFQELAEVAEDQMLREFRDQPGFIRYGLAEGGDRTCISISLWETRKDADAASAVSAAWDRDHVADRVELKRNQVGDLAFYEGVPAKV
jgi:heme-degrading monooxygenase HmoA